MGGEIAWRVERQALDGDRWRCRGYLGDEWRWARPGEPATPGRDGWLPASVPGAVMGDLLRAGEIADPYRERQSRDAEWVAERSWLYQTDLAGTPARDGERAQLVFEGIDYGGRIYLDGELIGQHRGMFVPARFEVGERLAGRNRHLLAVLIEPAPREEPQVGDTARVRTHKARVSYGWDFCPRLPQQGIWQPVWLRRSGPLRIEQPFIRSRLAADRRSATLAVILQLDAAVGASVGLSAEVTLEGAAVASAQRRFDVPGGVTPLELELALDEPALWWPNGHGRQPLYVVELRVELDGRLSDRAALSFGVRDVELAPNDGAPDGARAYRFVVNGRRIYLNGWNWVPIDALYGVPRPARLRHLLRLAQRAHVNLLRVWGGGLIESDDFYDACDRSGIMVWQEFVQSSSSIGNAPSEDPDFVSMMAHEAEGIVPGRRNHPSLVLWCGGNELASNGVPLDESAPVLGALRNVVARLDPDRPFLPTSPSGPVATNSLAAIERDPDRLHDVHGPWEHQGLDAQQRLYDRGTCLLHSEFGVEGMTNAAALEATIGPEQRWPATRDNPVYAHRGAWWNNEPLVQSVFGGDIRELGELRRASQLLQADGLRYAVEANLRRRWRSSGVIPWQLNEPFPNAWCTSALDYYGRPKPAYHAVAAAYEPVHVAAAFARQAWAGAQTFGAVAWVTTNRTDEGTGRLEARCLTPDGSELAAWSAKVAWPGSAATRLAELRMPLADVPGEIFLLDLALADGAGARLSTNRYLFSTGKDLAGLRRLSRTGLRVERSGAWELLIENSGPVLAASVRIEDGRPATDDGWALTSDDHLFLLPGEARRIEVEFDGVAEADRCLAVSGWNIEPIHLE